MSEKIERKNAGQGRCGSARRRSSLTIVFALGSLAIGGIGAKSQSAAPASQAPSDQDKKYQTLIRSTEGPDLYRAYCASCHGVDGKGQGPAAAAFKSKMPDLTTLAARDGGKFPLARVKRTILGDDVIAAHGSRDMPVWGPIFHQIEEDVDRGYVRVDNLLKYLQSIQTAPQKTK
jgi:mono/diheme cytochrome c family protein